MISTVPVGLYVPTDHYRALTKIAEQQGMQVHTLIESLVARALNARPAAPEPAAARRARKPRLLIDPDEFLRLHGEGLSDREIAEKLGTVRDTIANVRNRHQLPPNRKTRSLFADDDLRRLHAAGLTDVAIAATLGVNASTVGYRRNRLDLPKNHNGGRHRIHHPREASPTDV